MTGCAINAVVLGGEISNYVNIFTRSGAGTYVITQAIRKVYINGMLASSRNSKAHRSCGGKYVVRNLVRG